MISGKGIKVLCYVIMGFVFVLSIFLIIFSIIGMIAKNWISVIWLIVGLLLPLINTVSLYPLFVLANIDDKLSLLNKKVDTIVSKKYSGESKRDIITGNQTQDKKTIDKMIISETGKEQIEKSNKLILSQDILDFINQKYKIHIELDDSLDIIKFKISSINEKSSTANILIQKIVNANNMEDVSSAFILHKAVHG